MVLNCGVRMGSGVFHHGMTDQLGALSAPPAPSARPAQLNEFFGWAAMDAFCLWRFSPLLPQSSSSRVPGLSLRPPNSKLVLHHTNSPVRSVGLQWTVFCLCRFLDSDSFLISELQPKLSLLSQNLVWYYNTPTPR